MGRLRLVRQLDEMRHSIAGRIFISFLVLTIGISSAMALFWYQRTVDSTTGAIIEGMQNSADSSLIQLEHLTEDVARMHSTVVYDSNNLSFLLREQDIPPSAQWFEAYHQLYSSLRIMNVTLSRTVAGIGVYKADDSTCLYGPLGLGESFFTETAAQPVFETAGKDVLLLLDKPAGEQRQFIQSYVFVARAIQDVHGVKAIIITRLTENALLDLLGRPEDGFILLLDEKKRVLYDSNPGIFDEEKSTYLSAAAQGQELPQDFGHILYHNTSKHTGLTIVSFLSERALEEGIRSTRTQFALVLFVAILVAAILSFVVSKQITSGLQRLERNMRLVGEGKMDELLPVPGKDEVARLSHAFSKMTERIKQLMHNIKEHERQKQQMEIKVLRAQISPHFLYNSLNTINYLALMQSAQNIHVLVSSLIDLLHAAVDVDETLIPLEAEIKYVRSYLNVQQYRFPQRIGLHVELDHETDQLAVPKMILQPIVENALIHGFREGQADAAVILKAYAQEDALLISITDNGIGMSSEKIRQVLGRGDVADGRRFSGIGVNNVDSRIKLQFGEGYGVNIYSQQGHFTTVEILLPRREMG